MIKSFLENYIGQGLASEKLQEALVAFAVLGLIWVAVIFFGAFWLKIKLWKRPEFWFAGGTLAVLIIVKAAALRYLNNFIFDRLPIYALLSPKINFLWAVPAILGLFFLWLVFYKRLLRMSTLKFLIILMLFFVVFSVSVALTRDGVPGLYETFTHSRLDYRGDAEKIGDVGYFLKNYVALSPTFSQHGQVHPPGYILLHYLFIKLFGGSLLSLAFGVIFLGALAIVPVYFLARKFDEESARIATMLFIFAPAYVIFSATSVDMVFFLIASAFLLSLFSAKNYSGWILSGAIIALAMFFHFMSILFFPVAAVYSYLKTRSLKKTIAEMIIFTAAPLVIYLFVKIIFGYNIVANFISSRGLSAAQFAELGVPTGNASIGYYALYALMSIAAFFIYLSWPVIINYLKAIKGRTRAIFDDPQKILIVLGWVFLPVLLVTGIFMGETERLWMFLVPFFVLPAAKSIASDEDRSAVFMLLFLQIITVQIVFFTYW